MNSATLSDDAIRQLGNEVFATRIPFNDLIGFEMNFDDLENVQISFSMKEELVGNFMHGILHGGVTSAALDVVGGLAVFLAKAHSMPAGLDFDELSVWFAKLATIDLRVDFLRPGTGTDFTATANVLRAGNRVAAVRMDLHNERGVHIATGSGTYTLADIPSP